MAQVGSDREQRRAARRGGFTLIEVLVVLVIIGVVLTFATLSVNPSGSSDRLDTESQRLQALAQAAADDAVLYGQSIGLQLTRNGYQFIALKPSGWQRVNNPDSPLRPRSLDDDIHIDRGQVQNGNRRNNRGNDSSSGDLALPSSVVAPKENSQGNDDDDSVPRPDALFLSSGELVPFTLEVSADGVDHRFDVIGRPNGDITIERTRR